MEFFACHVATGLNRFGDMLGRKLTQQEINLAQAQARAIGDL